MNISDTVHAYNAYTIAKFKKILFFSILNLFQIFFLFFQYLACRSFKKILFNFKNFTTKQEVFMISFDVYIS